MAEKKKAKVLIVEDSAIDRENYRRLLLRNKDYEFTFRDCDNGEDGLKAFREEKPDCILLDYNLPDIDGIEFLSAVQSESADYAIPVVVMLTGQGSSTVAVEAMRRGARDYIVKSNINQDTLNTSVNAAIANVTFHGDRPVQKFLVLLVEDNPDDRAVYKRLLRESTHNRFEFREVGSGADGISEFKRSNPDCILLDYNLPDFDGLEFLGILAEMQEKAGLPMPVVVMLTGMGSENTAVEAMKRGVQDYLVKGELTREALHRSVTTAIEKRALATRLSEKEREFEQFCYAVAHDLQAPLRRTRGFCTLLVDSAQQHLNDDELEHLQLIDSNVATLQTLIHDLLGYYSVDRSTEPKSTVEMNQVISQAQTNLAEMLRERGAIIDVDELPPVQGFASLLILLFQNLIQNGIKFNRSVPPKMEIRCFETLRNWQISVRDNGIGIDMDYSKRVFKPFQRLQPNDAYPGSGLGLAICDKIVKLHGGYIWMDSQPGIGSVFNVQLPKTETE